jgi:hypothetical protein
VIELADYKEMYYTLFRAQVQAKIILEEAEKQTEAMFIEDDDSVSLAFSNNNKPKE